ncbi:MAG: Gfo/Idh/MocA family oxidoreductase [Victivallales bacterium]|nr:Gfo/Idh/MocA family oxidoreductase [Victivallales bacterium]
MSEPVKLIVLGCGSRGNTYASFAEKYPERAQVVAVADPREFYRNRIGDRCQVPQERRYQSWTEIAALPKFADAVLICLQDAMHTEPAIAFARLGYHILLEKPMAPTAEECRKIVKEVKEAGIIFAVCHVLRYTAYSRLLKKTLDAGAIGDLVSIQHLEPVRHWHQAHSFVRGNWRNEKESSFMLLAKCCHDLDWIRYMMNVPCEKIHSFGTLKHFTRANQPAGAADRCTDCPAGIEVNCPYSALQIYLRDRVFKGNCNWPTAVLTSDVTPDGVLKALREGPYGRCVYRCDNDVVDNQVVNFSFAGDRTGQMVMTAFCDEDGRQTRIFGTRGAIQADSRLIHVTDFLTGRKYDLDSETVDDGSILSGHGGGDFGLMEAFVRALETGDRSSILSGVDETLESHLMVFAAEESRRTGKVIDVR